MTKARSNAVAEAAKGDLSVGSGTNLASILAVGNNGETLVADSSATTGLRYNPSQAAGKNGLINGGFDIWQRGTSFAFSGSSYVYSADRWEHVRDGYATGATASRQTASLQGFRYAMRVQRDSGNTSIAAIYAEQSIETSQALPYCNTVVTVSFYARAGANYSASGSVLNARLFSGTGTDQALKNYTGAAIDGFNDVTLTTSWQRFSFKVTTSASANELGVNFRFAPTGTAGANDYFEVTGVQLELGSVPTAFTRAGGTIQGELAACQRYYWRNTAAPSVAAMASVGYAESATNANLNLLMPVEMRVAPTSVEFSSLRAYDGSALQAVSNVVLAGASTPKVANVTCTTAGLTTGRAVSILAFSSGTPYIGLSAEL
jgi:hypothetical protein